jgi:anti-anti-sigma factor
MEQEDVLPTVMFAVGGPECRETVFLAGELDVGAVGTLRSGLTAALESNSEVRVDLSRVRIVDSTVIRELLRAQALAARTNKKFGVMAPAPNVRRLLAAAAAAGLVIDPNRPAVRRGLASDGAG